MTSIAILSDIHSNAFALEAVLEDIKKHNISKIFNLGDSYMDPLNRLELMRYSARAI